MWKIRGGSEGVLNGLTDKLNIYIIEVYIIEVKGSTGSRRGTTLSDRDWKSLTSHGGGQEHNSLRKTG